MTEQQKQKAIRNYRTIKRREIKAKISDLNKKNTDLFKLWCYERSVDDAFLRKAARENLIEIEKLENAYDRAAMEIITEDEINQFYLGRKSPSWQ